MATTTTIDTPEKAKLDPMSYAEADKLGPFGGKASVLDHEIELRQALVAEFLATAETARDAAAAAERGAATAVHDYRKALRRARAVLALVADALPKSERRAVRRALQEARRALSTARDHAVAPDALAQLPLGEEDRATANAIVKLAGEAVPPLAEIKQLLAEGAARAAAQVEALEAALPTGLSTRSITKGIRGVYDDARRARKAAKGGKRSFHSWRRRSKELAYQLEVIGGFAGPQVAQLHNEIEAVTDVQSPAVDLVMVRDFVRTYSQGIAPEALDNLLMAIDAQLADLMKAARKASRGAFEARPRKFAKRLAKAIRRDLAPTEPDDDQAVA